MMIQSITQQLHEWLEREFNRDQFLPNLTAGLLLGITEIVFAISLGSLIFSGALADYQHLGIGMALASMAILLITTALTSSIPGVMGSLQDNPAVVLSLMVPALLVIGGGGGNLITVLVSIALASLLTGIFLLALGQFKLGGMVRFIPYPVVGGFLAGLGWLITQSSFDVMTGYPLTMDNLPILTQSVNIVKWFPGLVFALVMLVVTKRATHRFTLPALLTSAIVVYFLCLLLIGVNIQDALNMGLLVGEVQSANPWSELSFESFKSVNWYAILGQSGNFAVILVLSAIGLLFNISGLELVTERDINLNHELRVAGIVNIISGITGGMPGFQALSDTTLSYRIGGRGRLAGILAGLVCALVLLAGSNLLAYFPVAIMGGLLLYLGLDFLYDWIIGGWSQLSKADYAIVILILFIIATTDILIGIGVGLVAMVILFAAKYSQINVVQHDLTGFELRSNVQRSPHHRQILDQLGNSVHILELRGFIFFGTANTLLNRIRTLLQKQEDKAIRYIVLDFHRVSGLDSSAANSFVRIRQIAQAHGVRLVMTSVPNNIQAQLDLGGFYEDDFCVCYLQDLDHGLEWSENRLIASYADSIRLVQSSLQEWLEEGGFQKSRIKQFISYLERIEFNAGDYLIHQGDIADDMYFIERGQVSIYLEIDGAQQTRLSTMDTGTMIGEIGMFRESRRTASVIADQLCVAYRLTKGALEQMKKRDPDLAASFHELAARLLADRLTDTNLLVSALRR